MSLRKKNTFAQGRLFKPATVRQFASDSSFMKEQTAASLSGSNIRSTSSFRYDSPGTGVKSTQQLPVDFSKFENHTFFNSAEAKINTAFDTVINGYPFDGTKGDLEAYEDKLSGFENHILKRFPKNMGYLFFSGANSGADTVNVGSYIQVDDFAGALLPSLSRNRSGDPIIYPGTGSISFEMFLFVPRQTNNNQIVLQKLSGSNRGITLALSQSSSTTACNLQMLVSSGSAHLSASMSVQKGSFQHVCATFNRASGLDKLQLFLDSTLTAESSASFGMGEVDFKRSPLLIGSGTIHVTGTLSNENLGMIPQQTLSGAIDELRIFHEVRSRAVLKANMRRSVFPDSRLRAYFKFNESTGSHSNNEIVLDASGNSLHSRITNYTVNLRATGSSNIDGAGRIPPLRPVTLEMSSRNPILFPGDAGVRELNIDLLATGSQYDANNPNMITKLIPPHYLFDAASAAGFGLNSSGSVADIYSSSTSANDFPGGGRIGSPLLISMFLFTWAKYFDELKMYVDQFSQLLHPDYDSMEGIADQFIPFLAEYYGFQLPNSFPNASLNQYLEGEDLGVNTQLSKHGLQYVQNQIWKRILINMNDIIRSKGTLYSIKAFLRASGINPNRNFRFREFGGVRNRRIDDVQLRQNLTEVSAFLDMSGTLSPVTTTVSKLGVPDNKPFIMSPFLSASRVEVGWPTPSTADSGQFVQKNTKKYGIHGIYDRRSDGLLTSGSWTVEGIYSYPFIHASGSANHFATQSLARLHITGNRAPSTTHGMIANMLAFSGSELYTGSLHLFVRPSIDHLAPVMALEMTGVNIFDGDKWHVAFGRRRNDEVNSVVSSSYFITVGKQNWGRIVEYHTTSSFFQEATGTNYAADNVFQNLLYDSSSPFYPFNTSGSFIAIGSQSIGGTSTNFFLNSIAKVPDPKARTTHFSGRLGHMRFWSKALSGSEVKEHVRNFKSLGVKNPLVNFNFETVPTGAFGRLRIDVSTDQVVTKSDTLGNITLFDFSQQFVSGARSPYGNGASVPWLPQSSYNKTFFHMSGSGFELNKRVIKPERFDYSILTPKFDEASVDNKIRIAGFQDWNNIEELGGEVSPVHEMRLSTIPTDDTRFGVEVSSVQALNEDMINMFDTLDKFNNALGAPELVFATSYPELADLREVYFNRLIGKVNFRTFFEFFKWFDTSFGSIIESMIPRRTKFMGVDFVIESHMLERGKFNYNYEDVYLGENNRHGLRGQILMQQLIAKIQRI
jgi:hypothetical protein